MGGDSNNCRFEEDLLIIRILTSKAFDCDDASNGIDPNGSWLPFIKLLTFVPFLRGVAAFGGGATELIKIDPIKINAINKE